MSVTATTPSGRAASETAWPGAGTASDNKERHMGDSVASGKSVVDVRGFVAVSQVARPLRSTVVPQGPVGRDRPGRGVGARKEETTRLAQVDGVTMPEDVYRRLLREAKKETGQHRMSKYWDGSPFLYLVDSHDKCGAKHR